MHLDNLEAGKRFGLVYGFKVCTCVHYPWGFIRDDESKRDWLEKCTETWERKIHTIRKTTRKYTHESYAVVVCAMQSEWVSQQQVTNDTEDMFVGLVKILQEIFLPRLFFGNSKLSHSL